MGERETWSAGMSRSSKLFLIGTYGFWVGQSRHVGFIETGKANSSAAAGPRANSHIHPNTHAHTCARMLGMHARTTGKRSSKHSTLAPVFSPRSRK